MCNFALMFERIIHISHLIGQAEVLFWMISGLLVVCLLALFFWQLRVGKKLHKTLNSLSQLEKQNIEYEFVLKALRLAAWHVDPKTMNLTFDYDFREMGSVHTQADTPVIDTTTMLSKEDASRVANSMREICSGRAEEYHETYRVMIPGTNKFYWEESSAIITKRDVDGHPTGIVGTSMRIDERKNMEEALILARSKAEESDRLKSAFIANMSHEIRTPLNAIIGFTSVLPDLEGAAERREIINLIQENNQKLLRIIDDVMNISKIEAGDAQLVMTEFDLNPLLQGVVERFTARLQSGVVLNTSFAAEQLNVKTDMGRVEEVVDHLLSNAVKFTSQGTITVGYESPNGKLLRIWVKDTGKGVPAELQERIFERFFKVDEFVPGAGLGLSICRTMAFSLGGNVGVSSTVGEGSTFWLEIPV